MQIKTITGNSVPAALKRAKQLYGEEVILLESKEIDGQESGQIGKVVQITVSVAEKQKTVHPWSPPKIGRESKDAEKIHSTEPELQKGTPQNDFNKVITNILANKPKEMMQERKILDELAELRKEVLNLTKAKEEKQLSELPETFTLLESRLKDKGFDDDSAQNLIKRVYQFLEKSQLADEEEIIKGIKLELSREFRQFEFEPSEADKQQQVIMLVGSTGVGKTTTAMKLAAHPDIFGKKDVVIVSTDLYGPSEALKAFSKMSGTEIYEGKATDEIEGLLEKFKNKEVIIIDTPGQSPFAPNHLKKLEEYLDILNPTDIFMVHSMSTDLKDLFLSCAVYMLLKPTGIVFTKFDETTQPGKVFSVMNELELPAVSFSDGKRVFIDIEKANVDYLINKIFETA